MIQVKILGINGDGYDTTSGFKRSVGNTYHRLGSWAWEDNGYLLGGREFVSNTPYVPPQEIEGFVELKNNGAAMKKLNDRMSVVLAEDFDYTKNGAYLVYNNDVFATLNFYSGNSGFDVLIKIYKGSTVKNFTIELTKETRLYSKDSYINDAGNVITAILLVNDTLSICKINYYENDKITKSIDFANMITSGKCEYIQGLIPKIDADIIDVTIDKCVYGMGEVLSAGDGSISGAGEITPSKDEHVHYAWSEKGTFIMSPYKAEYELKCETRIINADLWGGVIDVKISDDIVSKVHKKVDTMGYVEEHVDGLFVESESRASINYIIYTGDLWDVPRIYTPVSSGSFSATGWENIRLTCDFESLLTCKEDTFTLKPLTYVLRNFTITAVNTWVDLFGGDQASFFLGWTRDGSTADGWEQTRTPKWRRFSILKAGYPKPKNEVYYWFNDQIMGYISYLTTTINGASFAYNEFKTDPGTGRNKSIEFTTDSVVYDITKVTGYSNIMDKIPIVCKNDCKIIIYYPHLMHIIVINRLDKKISTIGIDYKIYNLQMPIIKTTKSKVRALFDKIK